MAEDDDDDLPILPYAGTSGFAPGSDTSRERAERADDSGLTAERQRQAYAAVRDAGVRGITGQEYADLIQTPFHVAAPALSLLHDDDRIKRIKERRRGCEVYVLPEHVNGRKQSVRGHHGTKRDAVLEEVRVAMKVHREECEMFGVGCIDEVIDTLKAQDPKKRKKRQEE